MKYLSVLLTGVFMLPLFNSATTVVAQQLTPEDYKRAVSFLPNNLVNKEFFNLNVPVYWSRDNSGVAYMKMDKEGRHFELFEFAGGKSGPLFDVNRLVKVLSDSLRTTIKPANFQFSSGKVIDKNTVTFLAGNRMWKADLSTYALTVMPSLPANPAEIKSPDGKWAVYVKEYNLYLKSTATGASRKLSSDGTPLYQYGIEFFPDLQEEGTDPNFPLDISWSPDSKWIQTYITDFSNSVKSYFLNWTNDSLQIAQLLFQYRANAGDTTIMKLTPVFYEVEKNKLWIKEKSRGIPGSAPNYEWSGQPGVIYETCFQRGHKSFSFNRIDLNTMREDTLYRESAETFVDGFAHRLTEERNQLIFLSEKSGWRQLYKLNLNTRQVDPLASGEYYVNDIVDIDPVNGDIFFLASGRAKTINPYFEQLYRVNTKGDKLVLLTPGNMHHSISLSPDRKYFIDRMSTPEVPTSTVLRSAVSGEIVKDLVSVNKERLKEIRYPLPQSFTCLAADGTTPIYGMMWKPSAFDSTKKYPVVEYAYTGPHKINTPVDFGGAVNKGLQGLAELGFIVVTIDGRGVPGRSKKFHDYTYRNTGNCLEDHVIALKQLAKKYKWIDIERVGIMGGSAGGYDAVRGLLAYPDFYKVGVATSGNHDRRLSDYQYSEKYMGWPPDSSYITSSNLALAKNLKGKLLVACGALDDIVYPIATFRLVEELMKAGKDFEFMFFPSQGHVFPKYEGYFFKKRWNYFVEHLAGQTPYWDYEIK